MAEISTGIATTGSARRWWPGNWWADAIVAAKSGTIIGTALVWLLLYGYIMHIAGDTMGPGTPAGYFVRQSLLAAALFGSWAVIVVAAWLGARDNDWGTWGLRLTGNSRTKLMVNRLVAIGLMSIGLTLVFWLPGALLDQSAALGGYSSTVFTQLAAAAGMLTLWGCLAFAVATLTRSFALSAAGTIVYVLLEEFLEARLPAGVLAVLPHWNCTVVLAAIFPDDNGGVGAVAVHQGHVPTSLLVCAAYLVAAVIVSVLAMRRRGL